MMDKARKQDHSVVRSFAVGGVTAIISKTATAPIDRVKILLQSQNEIMKLGRMSEPYKGVLNCISRTFKSEGLLSFWRGNIAGCTCQFSSQGISFALKDKVNAAIKISPTDSHGVVLIKKVASGGLAGAMTLGIVYSMDYTRTRLANDVRFSKNGNDRQFKGIIDVYKKTFRSDGIVGLYRGFVVSCVGITVYRGLYFGLYDSLKPIFLGDNASVISSYLFGFGVTLCAGLMSYPLDTTRKRMMMRSGEKSKYKGAIDCAAQILRKEGPMSFMKGFSLTILQGIFGAAMLVGYGKWHDKRSNKNVS